MFRPAFVVGLLEDSSGSALVRAFDSGPGGTSGIAGSNAAPTKRVEDVLILDR